MNAGDFGSTKFNETSKIKLIRRNKRTIGAKVYQSRGKQPRMEAKVFKYNVV